jgi:two-component system nitrate/nitrite response regulator NarP
VSRILLADDHPMIRTALEALLRGTDFDIVATSSTGEDALRDVARVEPDLLLLDLQMPGGTGMDVIRTLTSGDAKVKIIVLTAGIDDASLVEAKALGVRGLVLKSSDPAYLLECLERVNSGGTWIDPEVEARIEELSGTLAASPRPSLAPRERQLIRFVSKGLRNREIAKELGVTEGTVKVYLHAVFEKLGVSSRTELAVRADEFLASSYLKG